MNEPEKERNLKGDPSLEISSQFAARVQAQGQSIAVLSLDGGGVRGLVEIEQLIVLRDAFRHKTGNKDAEIRDMFDLICGTSTGGILAFALQQGTPLETLQEMYCKMPERLFNESGWSKFWHWLATIGEARYSDHELKNLVNEYFQGKLPLQDEKVRAGPKVFCVAKRKGVDSWCLFCNYGKRNSFPVKVCERVSVSEALRATSAAPTYFPPVSIQIVRGQEINFEDGGIGYNNPVMLAVGEARMPEFMSKKCVIVSLGTGRQSISKPHPRVLYLLRLMSELTMCATASHKAHQDAKKSIKGSGHAYFRLDPYPEINDPSTAVYLGDIPLDAWQPRYIETMQQETRQYMARKEEKVKKIIADLGDRGAK